MGERRFAELARAHRAIDELFLKHQEALVDRELRDADRLLFLLGDSLRRHLHDEERLLFPSLDSSIEIAGATREILLKEHERILALLGEIEKQVEQLELSGERAARRIVELLDQEGVLKRLIEHHEAREESLVFPALDERVEATERARILGACWVPE